MAHQCCRLSALLSTLVPAEASSELSQTLQGWREAEWLENCLSFGHSVRHQKKKIKCNYMIFMFRLNILKIAFNLNVTLLTVLCECHYFLKQ